MIRKLTFFALFSLTFIALLLPSCKKFEGSQTVPAYIRIDTVSVNCDYFIYGANTHKIIDAWVFVDDYDLGCFELPATFPVLKEGVHKISVYPGIARDGIRDIRAPYPFMKPWENAKVNLVRDSIVTLNPVFTYYPAGVDENMHIRWKEGFEDGTITLQASTDSDAPILRVNGPLAWHDQEGIYSTYSAKLVLPSDTSQFYITNTESFADLPPLAENSGWAGSCMLEMDYKCSDTCMVGLHYYKDYRNTKETILRLRPTGTSGVEPEQWNKIYINIGPYLIDNEGASWFKIYFASWPTRNDGTQYFYFDNLKLIYRDR